MNVKTKAEPLEFQQLIKFCPQLMHKISQSLAFALDPMPCYPNRTQKQKRSTMKTVFLSLILISSFAYAETVTLTIEGMHCSSCTKIITKNVCENEAIKKNTESCEVKITDEKKQLGQIVIVSKKEAVVDLAAVKDGVKASGDNYQVIKEIKSQPKEIK